MDYSLKTLELNIILEEVAKYGISLKVKNLILDTKPSSSFQVVKDLLNKTDELFHLFELYGSFPFINDYEISKIINTLKVINYLSIKDIIKIKDFVSMTNLFSAYNKQVDLNYPLIKELLKQIVPITEISKLINNIFDSNNEILSNASKELSEIRRKINSKNNELDKRLQNILRKYQSYLNENLIVMRENRYTIPIKDAYKRQVKGVVHDLSQSGQTVYIEPDEIREISQEIEFLKKEEEKEVIKILTLLTKELKPFVNDLLFQVDILVTLDTISAKALYAKEIKGVKPKINNDGIINLIKARHPLINKDLVVPIDVSLDSNYKVLMITGPNTGGKTVALKTVGLLTLMAQSGLLIPALKDSNIAIFNQVLADIGDEQSIVQSLSTFSSHISKIKNMVENLKVNSLILLDELGSGTDPVEGVSLAKSIINYLKNFPKTRLILTTHYSELKMYAFSEEDILTASVSFDLETLMPLYKLKLGIAGSSNALLIAEKLGLNINIIKDAKTILNENRSNLSFSLEKLTNEQNKLENLKDELLLKEKKLETKIKLYEEELKRLELNKNKIIEDVKSKELKKYEQMKKEALNILEELSKKKVLSTPEYAKYKGIINQKEPKKVKEKSLLIKLGDHVLVTPYNEVGIVTKVKNKDYYVSFGNFELPFKSNDLIKTDEPLKKKEEVITKDISSTPTKNASFELDLRGVRYIDVNDLLDKAIDDALLANLPSLRIIHGFGTGAIRKAVYEYIKNSTTIKSHRYGGEGEGLNGVTIITL